MWKYGFFFPLLIGGFSGIFFIFDPHVAVPQVLSSSLPFSILPWLASIVSWGSAQQSQGLPALARALLVISCPGRDAESCGQICETSRISTE